jgi:hypothetical protein
MPSVSRTADETTCMLECSSPAMSLNMKTMRKKSNASSVQPRYAAITTLRCFLVHAIDAPLHESAPATILRLAGFCGSRRLELESAGPSGSLTPPAKKKSGPKPALY